MRCDLGKSRKTDREFTREQKLVHENQRLKREISKLRKELARLDLDRYNTVREMIEDYSSENKASTDNILESLKEEWKCRNCSVGYLEIIVYSKLGEPWYIRACNHCKNRTKSQKYDKAKVKGIVKNSN